MVGSLTGSKRAEQLTNTIANIIQFGYLLVGIVGGAKIISHFGTISYELALLLTIFVVTGYVVLAGMKAVIATDVIQSFIILFLLGLIAYVLTAGVDFSEVFSAQVDAVSISTIFGFLLFGIFSVFSTSNFYQLIFAGKDERSSRVGLAASIAPVLLVASILLIIGLFTRYVGAQVDPDLAFIHAISNYVPASLLPAGIILFFAALMSSADTSMYAVASHYVLTNKDEPRKKERIRYAILFIAVLALIIGLLFRDVVNLTLVVAFIGMTLSCAMIYVIAGGRNVYRFTGSVISSLLGLVLGLILFGIKPPVAIFVILFGAFGLLYNGWFLSYFKKTNKPF